MSTHEDKHLKKSKNRDGRGKTVGERDPVILELGCTSIVHSLPMGVIIFDSDLKIIEANSEAKKLIEICDTVDESFAKGTDSSGSPEINWAKQIKSAISSGESREFNNVNYTLGSKAKFLHIICTSLKKAKTAEILGGTIIIEDITEKVNVQRQLANAERLATVGKLASKVAHELNNPMDGILRYINLAMRIIEREKLEKPKEYLTQCRQGLMRMVQIVSELLEFSRRTYASLEYVELEQIIEDAIRTMDARAEACNIRILRNYSRNIPQIRNGNLFQVFCNLIKNALESMPAGGQLNISARLEADDMVVVEFHDTGTGFPEEYADAIFEPFFTTKDRGTGLGLAICKEIIEKYRGRITAENAPAGGCIFTAYLPIAGNLQENP